MSLRRIIVAAAGALAACTESSVVEPTGTHGSAERNTDAGPAYSAAASRPIGGTCAFAAAPLPQLPQQPANVARFALDESCHLSHLGLTTASAEEVVTFTASGTTAVFTTTYVAANGDRLVTTLNTTGTFPDQGGIALFSGTETVTGGTGRFAGASGSFSVEGSVSVITFTGEYTINGSLTY